MSMRILRRYLATIKVYGPDDIEYPSYLIVRAQNPIKARKLVVDHLLSVMPDSHRGGRSSDTVRISTGDTRLRLDTLTRVRSLEDMFRVLPSISE